MIYFVRHGETEYNALGIVQGQLDIPLNEKGIKQAEALAEKLKDFPLDIIYTSPLSRARKTAEIVNKYHNVEIICEQRFTEFHVGQKQGQKTGEWTKEMNEDFMLNPEKYGAESNESFYNRVSEAYKDLPADKNILVVAHAGVYRSILRYKENKPFEAHFTIVGNAEIQDISK